uniref:Uncharacterized protein n=1 Tax=Hyaloperonospora arabidopsidis (strain Emoy2) TaxID=559515 RepID=M4B7Y4_HYAAE
MSGRREASCRLDRWYCSSSDGDWVRATSTSIPGPFSVHNGVALRVAVPDRTMKVKPRRQVYPPPRYAARAFEVVTTDFFTGASAQLEGVIANVVNAEEQARAAAMWWDTKKMIFGSDTPRCPRMLVENQRPATAET